MAKRLPPEKLETSFWPFRGGIDINTPQIMADPGAALDALNYEIPQEDGYRRTAGYERFDGRTSPSLASILVMYSTTAVNAAAVVGAAVTGATSGATGTICQVVGTSYFVLTAITGSFTNGEQLKVGATVVATYTNIPNVTRTAFDDNVSLQAAANIYRNAIGQVPGSGPIRGVWVYNSTVYAFRDNAGGTAGGMWKATATGWVQIAMQYEVAYTAGNAALGALQVTTEGGGTGTLTQSAVNATVVRVTLQSGAFASGTAQGTMLVLAPTGGNFAAGAATATGGATCTLGGIQTQVVIPAGGHYEFRNRNFYGNTLRYRMYGVSGQGRAFEFDGTYYVPITTGGSSTNSGDTPKFMEVHQSCLFVTIGPAMLFSGAGNPFAFSANLNGGEIDIGADCTGLLSTVGNNVSGGLLVFTRKRTYMLYGTQFAGTGNNAQFSIAAPEVGARPYTAQMVTEPIFVDRLGVTTLVQTFAYGNFEQALLTDKVKKLINDRIDAAVCSTVVRRDNQYRIFFNDGSQLVGTFRGKQIEGWMLMQWPDVFSCACETDDLGVAIFAGGQNSGYVYQLNQGRSFDGQAITAYLRMSFNHLKTPRVVKHFKRVTFELELNGATQFYVGYQTSLGSNNYDQSPLSLNQTQGGGSLWDQFIWDQDYWDASVQQRSTISLQCEGADISLYITGTWDNQLTHTIQGALIEFVRRRQVRFFS